MSACDRSRHSSGCALRCHRAEWGGIWYRRCLWRRHHSWQASHYFSSFFRRHSAYLSNGVESDTKPHKPSLWRGGLSSLLRQMHFLRFDSDLHSELSQHGNAASICWVRSKFRYICACHAHCLRLQCISNTAGSFYILSDGSWSPKRCQTIEKFILVHIPSPLCPEFCRKLARIHWSRLPSAPGASKANCGTKRSEKH